jgi:hypothetical protein
MVQNLIEPVVFPISKDTGGVTLLAPASMRDVTEVPDLSELYRLFNGYLANPNSFDLIGEKPEAVPASTLAELCKQMWGMSADLRSGIDQYLAGDTSALDAFDFGSFVDTGDMFQGAYNAFSLLTLNWRETTNQIYYRLWPLLTHELGKYGNSFAVSQLLYSEKAILENLDGSRNLAVIAEASTRTLSNLYELLVAEESGTFADSNPHSKLRECIEDFGPLIFQGGEINLQLEDIPIPNLESFLGLWTLARNSAEAFNLLPPEEIAAIDKSIVIDAHVNNNSGVVTYFVLDNAPLILHEDLKGNGEDSNALNEHLTEFHRAGLAAPNCTAFSCEHALRILAFLSGQSQLDCPAMGNVSYADNGKILVEFTPWDYAVLDEPQNYQDRLDMKAVKFQARLSRRAVQTAAA